MEDSSDAEGEDAVMADEGMDHTYGAEHDHDLDGNESDDLDAVNDYLSDTSSSLSIPNESIDFDLVYSLTNFAATVEGQASVVKGDSLFLMDDSNSYWWLVRVLKTQEVGYIPAENIETPFERLARLNKHRNVDVCFVPYAFSFLCHWRMSSPAFLCASSLLFVKLSCHSRANLAIFGMTHA